MKNDERPTDGTDPTPDAAAKAARPTLNRPPWLVRLAWRVLLTASACLLVAGCCCLGGGESGPGRGSWLNPQPPDPPNSIEEFMRLRRLDP